MLKHFMIKEWKQFGLIKVKMNLDYKNWNFYHKNISIQFVSVLVTLNEWVTLAITH